MISILPSEGLAPAQSATKQNKLSDPSSKSDEFSFSSLVSRDSADGDAASNSDAPASDAAAARPSESSATAPQSKAAIGLNASEQIDPAILDQQETVAAPIETEAPRPNTEIDTKVAPPTDTRIPQTGQSAEAQTDVLPSSDADLAASGKREPASALAGTASAEQSRATDALPTAPLKTEQTTTESADAATKLARGAPEVTAQTNTTATAKVEPAEDTLRIIRQQDGAEVPQTDLKTAQFASEAELASSTNKSLFANAAPEARAPTAMTALPEALLSVAQPSSVSAPALTAGLTPVAPSIPMAAPNEISSIILNALKNGGEPQEQLIVQLDPPELGRVAIDFKFDAQGIQQITVTSENPEALRRLRELHFELTEALKDHGLSEQNLSFRQEADDQSQPAWQMPELSRSGDVFSSNEDPQGQTPLPRSNSAYTQPDRLDLTL